MTDNEIVKALECLAGEEVPCKECAVLNIPYNECPIARHSGEGIMGIFIYDSREEAIEAWNRRTGNG